MQRVARERRSTARQSVARPDQAAELWLRAESPSSSIVERVNSRVLNERCLTDVAEGGLLSERLPSSVERGRVTERVTASKTVRGRSIGERLPPALPTVREPGV